MNRRSYSGVLVAALVVLAALVLAPQALGQFGQFGQNKIAYERFAWKVYRSPHFDIHYYGSTEERLADVISHAESAYFKISKDLDHELRVRVPLILYATHGDFEQTNVTLGEVPEAVGAFAEPVQNRMVLPIDQPPDKLYALIAHELTHIFQYSIFFEGYLGRALRASPPTWLMEGLASYLAQDEDNIDRMAIRDAVVNNVLPSIRALNVVTFLTYRYGHAIFDFIESEHGPEGIRNFVYEYRKALLANNVEKAIKESFGYDVAEFDRRFNQFLRKKYLPVLIDKKEPEQYGTEVGVKKEGVFTFSPTLSPSGELIAALAAPGLELDLLVLSAEDGSRVRNITKGWTNDYRHLVAEAFQGKRDLSWSPAGDEVAIFVRRENLRPLFIFDAVSGRKLREFPLRGFAQCASPAFSPDGTRIAFEANRDGVVDLFELEIATGAVRNLTQDLSFDANPWYAADGKSLLYNRRIGTSWKIFSVDLADPARKTQITFGPANDIQPSLSRDATIVWFASDRNDRGIFNVHALDLATGEVRQYTDVVGGCFSPVEMAPRDGEPYVVFTAFFEGTFRLFRMPIRQPERRSTPDEASAATAIETFEPPLALKADPDKVEPYKARWDIDAPAIDVAVADDGTFYGNVNLQFSDLLGDQRAAVRAFAIADLANTVLSYANFRHRLQWGATLFDLRDYYVFYQGGGYDRRQTSRSTGGDVSITWPVSRYYRFEGSLGVVDQSQDVIVGSDQNGLVIDRIGDQYVTAGAGVVGDTTRYQYFGPVQGKRFQLNAWYAFHVSGDIPDDVLRVTADFRAYRQLTQRSLFAYRLAAFLNESDRDVYVGLGGVNQLRGYSFREFFGSKVVWTNLELRYPLVEEMRFPFGAIRSIRGFVFLDAGAAWLRNDAWYDPETFSIRADIDALGRTTLIPFEFWDGEGNRLQDLRASWGFGFQFFFLGGLQFNWSWAKRLPYTQYVDVDPNPFIVDLEKAEAPNDGWRSDFYIVFDF